MSICNQYNNYFQLIAMDYFKNQSTMHVLSQQMYEDSLQHAVSTKHF